MKLHKALFALSVLAFGLSAGLSSAQTVISATDSTWTAFFASGDQSQLGYLRVGNYGNAVSFMHFDVSSLTSAEVNASGFSADLNLTTVGGGNDNYGTQTIDVAPVNMSWVKTEDAPNNGLNASALGATSGSLTINHTTDPIGTTYSINVTSLIQGWVNGTITNNGLGLYDPTNANLSTFASYQDTTNGPFLDVTFGAAVPETSTWLWLFSGLVLVLALRRRRQMVS